MCAFFRGDIVILCTMLAQHLKLGPIPTKHCLNVYVRPGLGNLYPCSNEVALRWPDDQSCCVILTLKGTKCLRRNALLRFEGVKGQWYSFRVPWCTWLHPGTRIQKCWGWLSIMRGKRRLSECWPTWFRQIGRLLPFAFLRFISLALRTIKEIKPIILTNTHDVSLLCESPSHDGLCVKLQMMCRSLESDQIIFGPQWCYRNRDSKGLSGGFEYFYFFFPNLKYSLVAGHDEDAHSHLGEHTKFTGFRIRICSLGHTRLYISLFVAINSKDL